MKRVAILGSTGSIGLSTLKVISHFKKNFIVHSLSCKSSIHILNQQIKKFHPAEVVVIEKEKARELKREFVHFALKEQPRIHQGIEGLIKIATSACVDIVIIGLVGKDGLFPTLEAIRAGKIIGLANKEILVSFGKIIMEELKRARAKGAAARIIPLDSELNALYQCLEGRNIKDVSKIILTATGGPFYRLSGNALQNITLKQTLKHPVWKMGKKISIDSATLMNKGLEIMEICNYFSLPSSFIEVVIHPQAIVHGMVSFIDGANIALLAQPDMCVPIQYSLFYPQKAASFLPALDLKKASRLDFYPPDERKFPCLRYARQAIDTGGTMPAVSSASDEIAVEAFLKKKISFFHIPQIINKVMNRHRLVKHPSLDTLLKADSWAREETRRWIEKIGQR